MISIPPPRRGGKPRIPAAAGSLLCAALIGFSTATMPGARAGEPATPEEAPALRSSRPLATWAWDWTWAPIRPEGFENYARGLLDLCAKKNIDTIYLSLDFPVPGEQRAITAQFLERAHAQGVRVEASAFARSHKGVAYSHPGGEQGFYDYLDGVLAWNREHPAGQRFDGAHFDVEEYTETWIDALRHAWEGETLAELKKIDPAFKLGAVAVPALWWGRDYGLRLQDCTDYIACMSYYQGDTTLGFFTGPSKAAIDHAGKTGKKLHIGLEVSIWRGEGEFFAGWEYMSFFTQGEAEFMHRLEKINSAFAGHPGFGGVVVQSSDAYQRMHLVSEEIARDRRLHGKADAAAEPLPSVAQPVEIAGFTTKPHHSADDKGMKTRLATFDLSPPIRPGEVLVFDIRFAAHNRTRPNPLTENTVPAELFWFGFADPDPFHRFLRMDFNGGLGIRTVSTDMKGAPGDWKDIFRISHDRCQPEPDRTYEGRLHFFGDSRVLLKIIDPEKKKVVWHSDRMPVCRGQLARMYAEIADDPEATDAVAYDAADRAIHFMRGGKAAATIGNLRRATLPADGAARGNQP